MPWLWRLRLSRWEYRQSSRPRRSAQRWACIGSAHVVAPHRPTDVVEIDGVQNRRRGASARKADHLRTNEDVGEAELFQPVRRFERFRQSGLALYLMAGSVDTTTAGSLVG